jgi:pimeloyl-ACP methyl ester carboxylesterase
VNVFRTDLGIRSTAIVGNSLGGRVAIESALTDPGSVTRMVLLCPSPAFRRMRQFVPLVHLLSPDAVIVPQPVPHRLVVLSIRRMFSRPDRLPGPWYDAAADEYLRIMRSYRHRRAFYAALRQIYLEPAYGEEGFWDRLPRLQIPALFVWGDRDRLVPSSFAHHVLAAVPRAESIVLPDCGHVPQFEHPETTVSLVRDFLTR